MATLRFALRSLAKSPRFAIASILTLALGIGANAAIFSIVDRIVLHPFPGIAAPERVVWLFESAGKTDLDRDSVEAANFADWRAQATKISHFGALTLAELTITSGGEPERVSGQECSAGYFAVMGLRPHLGRFFTASEEQPGAPRVAVLGHGLWQRRFGGDPGIVGRALEINGQTATVVGVLPRDFVFPRTPDLVVPLRLDAAAWANRKQPAFAAMARLAPGASIAEADAELDVIAARLEREHPDTNRELRVAAVPIEKVFTRSGPVLALLVGVGFLLLIACANVANLQLARGVARRREMAVRAALGASRGRLIVGLLVESAIIALAGAALGLLVAHGALGLLLASLPAGFHDRLPLLRLTALNGDVVLFSMLLAGVTTLLVGLVPALRASRVDLGAALKEGAGGSAGGKRRLMGVLVASQLALATLLVAGSGAMLRSFIALESRAVGFHADGVATLRLPLAARHPEPAERLRFVDGLLERLAGLPGAGPVAATTSVPSTDNASGPFTVVGQPPLPREDTPHAHFHGVTPDLFRALELPLVAGRGFTRVDAGSKRTIISAALARRVFGERDPIGQRVQLPDDAAYEIVGVAGDVPDPLPGSAALGELYFPWDGGESEVVLTVRAADPVALGAMARAAVHELDPRQVVEAQRPLEQLLSERIANQRMGVWVVGVTSMIALILAALGMYALVAYAVGQRTRELGIRIALGARDGAVMAAVLRGALLLVVVGVAAGIGLALPVVKGLEAVFFSRAAAGGHGLVLACVGGGLAVVAMCAGVLPARRALKVDPMIVLRAE